MDTFDELVRRRIAELQQTDPDRAVRLQEAYDRLLETERRLEAMPDDEIRVYK